MSDNRKTYEAMLLLEAGTSDFNAASEPVRTILERHSAEVLSMNPWEERRLAYEIKGHKRGLYILAYLKLDPETISEIEHDCQLSEKILRVLILQRESLSEQELAGQTPATIAAARAEQAAEAAEKEAAEKAAETPAEEPAAEEAAEKETAEKAAETPVEKQAAEEVQAKVSADEAPQPEEPEKASESE